MKTILFILLFQKKGQDDLPLTLHIFHHFVRKIERDIVIKKLTGSFDLNDICIRSGKDLHVAKLILCGPFVLPI